MNERKTIPIQDINEASNCSSAEPYALMVLGDSMLPEFEEGEIIVVEPSGLVKDVTGVQTCALPIWWPT